MAPGTDAWQQAADEDLHFDAVFFIGQPAILARKPHGKGRESDRSKVCSVNQRRAIKCDQDELTFRKGF